MAAAPLTCILTCYNPHPREFRQMLESLAASTFKNFDVIVVDDASRGQAHILNTTHYFPLMRAIVQPAHRGLAAARNVGVQAARSEYFLQFDQDDILEPTFIEKALWALDCHPQWAFCNSWHRLFGHDTYDWPHGFEGRADFLDANQTIPAAIIRRQAHLAIGGYDETIVEGGEDWDYWLRMAAHGYWGGTLTDLT